MPLFSSYGAEKGGPPVSSGGGGLPPSQHPAGLGRTCQLETTGVLLASPVAWTSARCLTLTFFSISSRTRLCCSAMAKVALWTRW